MPDFQSGILLRRADDSEVRPSSRVYGGIRVRLAGVEYYLHRLIYKLAYNEEPYALDHIDGNRANNRLSNLRAVSDRENMRNKARYRNNLSGHANIQPIGEKWRVRFKVSGRTIHLGRFATIEAAITARDHAKATLGFHPNHGRPA